MLVSNLVYRLLIPDWSTHIEYRAIVLLENNVVYYGLSGTQRLRMILYADDIAVLSNNADELAEILRIYNRIYI